MLLSVIKKSSFLQRLDNISSNTYLMLMSFIVLCASLGYLASALFFAHFYAIPRVDQALSMPSSFLVIFLDNLSLNPTKLTAVELSALVSGLLFWVTLRRRPSHVSNKLKSTLFIGFGLLSCLVGADQAFSAHLNRYHASQDSLTIYFQHVKTFEALFQLDRNTGVSKTFAPNSDTCISARRLTHEWAEQDPTNMLMGILDNGLLIRSYQAGCISSQAWFDGVAKSKIKAEKSPIVMPTQVHTNAVLLSMYAITASKWCMNTKEWSEPSYANQNRIDACVTPALTERVLKKPVSLKELGILPK